jgi:hypothetical protein
VNTRPRRNRAFNTPVTANTSATPVSSRRASLELATPPGPSSASCACPRHVFTHSMLRVTTSSHHVRSGSRAGARPTVTGALASPIFGATYGMPFVRACDNDVARGRLSTHPPCPVHPPVSTEPFTTRLGCCRHTDAHTRTGHTSAKTNRTKNQNTQKVGQWARRVGRGGGGGGNPRWPSLQRPFRRARPKPTAPPPRGLHVAWRGACR